jgi:hydrogenase-4 component B
MDACGGLVKRMPWTAACFLVGAASISALPPLNGFVSEWLAFQALFQSVRLAQPGLNVLFAVGIAALALTAGLAAACFVRAFGITFLAMPRSPGAARAHEADWAMRGAMVALAITCGVLGLGATAITSALARVSASTLGVAAAPIHVQGTVVDVADGFAALSPPLITAALVAGLLVPWMLLKITSGARRSRAGETWACGRILQTARMQYTATAFADPFKRVFRFFYRSVPRFEMEVHPESRFFVQRITYANPVPALFEEWLYRPLLRTFRAGIHRMQALQSGSASAYLAYILGALLVLLALR